MQKRLHWLFQYDKPSIRINKRIRLGRGKVEVRIEDRTLSREHCVLELRENEEVWITDLGSSGGTFLNDKRLEPFVPKRVEVKSTIRAGAQRYHYMPTDSKGWHKFINSPARWILLPAVSLVIALIQMGVKSNIQRVTGRGPASIGGIQSGPVIDLRPISSKLANNIVKEWKRDGIPALSSADLQTLIQTTLTQRVCENKAILTSCFDRSKGFCSSELRPSVKVCVGGRKLASHDVKRLDLNEAERVLKCAFTDATSRQLPRPYALAGCEIAVKIHESKVTAAGTFPTHLIGDIIADQGKKLRYCGKNSAFLKCTNWTPSICAMNMDAMARACRNYLETAFSPRIKSANVAKLPAYVDMCVATHALALPQSSGIDRSCLKTKYLEPPKS